jgi:predicted acyl esterase
VRQRTRWLVLILVLSAVVAVTGADVTDSAAYTVEEVMVPVRDGAHLQTVIITPKDHAAALPILLKRTPYGVPKEVPTPFPTSLKELAGDGYIFVYQNLRGRFKSEGIFKLSSQVNLNDPKDTNMAFLTTASRQR